MEFEKRNEYLNTTKKGNANTLRRPEKGERKGCGGSRAAPDTTQDSDRASERENIVGAASAEETRQKPSCVQLGPKPPRFLVSPPFDVFGRLPRERHDTQLNQERENAEGTNKLASCKTPLYKREKDSEMNKLADCKTTLLCKYCSDAHRPPAYIILGELREESLL
jgi:hypothetical protein